MLHLQGSPRTSSVWSSQASSWRMAARCLTTTFRRVRVSLIFFSRWNVKPSLKLLCSSIYQSHVFRYKQAVFFLVVLQVNGAITISISLCSPGIGVDLSNDPLDSSNNRFQSRRCIWCCVCAVASSSRVCDSWPRSTTARRWFAASEPC